MRTQGKVQIQRPIQLESNTQLTEPKAPKTSHWISASLMHLSAYESSSFSSRHIMNADCRMQPPFFSAHVVQRLTEGGEGRCRAAAAERGTLGTSEFTRVQWAVVDTSVRPRVDQERRVVSSCVSCHLRVESFESIETLRAARVCRRKGPRLQLYRNITGLPGTVFFPRCLFTGHIFSFASATIRWRRRSCEVRWLGHRAHTYRCSRVAARCNASLSFQQQQPS